MRCQFQEKLQSVTGHHCGLRPMYIEYHHSYNMCTHIFDHKHNPFIHLILNFSILLTDNLTCDENQIMIFFHKPLLKVSSASQLQLQLQLLDSSCKPQEKKFYYVFITSLTDCGTTRTSENNNKTVSFHNKVVERLSAFDKSISRSKEIHSPFKCIYPKSYLVSSTTFGLVDFAITSNNASSEDKMSPIMGLYKYHVI